MKPPFRVSETPAFVRVMDAAGNVIAHITTLETRSDGTTAGMPYLPHAEVQRRAELICTALNRLGVRWFSKP